jgi:N-acetylmuramoyl-L-alanine amidase
MKAPAQASPSRSTIAALALATFGCAPAAGLRPSLTLPLDWSCPESVPREAYRDPRVLPECTAPPELLELLELLRPEFQDDLDPPPGWAALRRYASTLTSTQFQAMLERFVNPDGSLTPHVLVDPVRSALVPEPVLAPEVSIPFLAPAPATSVGATPPMKAQPLLEPLAPDVPFRRERWMTLRAGRGPRRPFGPLRVAIDPGHLGGEFARLERRLYLWGPAESGARLSLREGDLTLRTALELATKLEADGVEVRLTRTESTPRFREPPEQRLQRADRFERGLAADPAIRALLAARPARELRRLRTAAVLHHLRTQLTTFDLRERVRALADFAPDALVVLHYNAGAWETGARADTALIAMVRGMVQAHRVRSSAARHRAVRDAFELDEFNASVHLAAACMRGMSETLELPVADVNRYADHQPVGRSDGSMLGVDAWNGLVFRVAEWPAVLLEGPFMNERDETPRLARALEAPLHAGGTRTERYAEGVARGLRAWASRWLEREDNAFGPIDAGEYR